MIFNESPPKIDFWPCLHFWLCQGQNGHFGLLGPKNNQPSSQTATCRKTEGVQSYVSMLGRYTPIELGLSEPKKWGLYVCSVKKSRFFSKKEPCCPSSSSAMQRCQHKNVALLVYHYDGNKMLGRCLQKVEILVLI